MRVALVHDYLTQYGGAERVLDEFHALWPDAPVFTSLYDPERMPSRYKDWDIRTSWLNRIPFARKKHQALLPLYPQAFESFDLSGYDLVLSSSSGFCHGVLSNPDAVHVCYSHSPPRFLWDYHKYVASERLGRGARLLIEPHLTRLRMWDRVSVGRTDAWISTSKVVQARLRKFYEVDSTIISPPAEINRFTPGTGDGNYFLMLMRLVGWKRPDIVVEAATRLSLPLVVAGDGRDEQHLRRMAGPTVRFVGRADDEQMKVLYRDAKALVLPSEEDFGITPLEAMATGRPVIAFGRGGVLDTVAPGRTGLFFSEQTADAVGALMSEFDPAQFDPLVIRRHAEQYDSAHFRSAILKFVTNAIRSRMDGGVLRAAHVRRRFAT